MRQYNNGAWTPARFRGFIVSALRAAMRRWQPKWDALKAASVGKRVNQRTGRQAEHFKCESCKKHFVAKDVQVDHIEPVVDPVAGFIDWETFIDRLFCEADNLQVLCKECHKAKTLEERKERKRK